MTLIIFMTVHSGIQMNETGLIVDELWCGSPSFKEFYQLHL